MKINPNMPREPVLEAVIWHEGLEVPPMTLVRLHGRTYLNLQRTGYNLADPTMVGSGYTKALDAISLIRELIKMSKLPQPRGTN